MDAAAKGDADSATKGSEGAIFSANHTDCCAESSDKSGSQASLNTSDIKEGEWHARFLHSLDTNRLEDAVKLSAIADQHKKEICEHAMEIVSNVCDWIHDSELDERGRFASCLLLNTLCVHMNGREVVTALLEHIDRFSDTHKLILTLQALTQALATIKRRRFIHVKPCVFAVLAHTRTLSHRFRDDPDTCLEDLKTLLPYLLDFLTANILGTTASLTDGSSTGGAAAPPPPPPPPPADTDAKMRDLLTFACFQLLADPLFYYEISSDSQQDVLARSTLRIMQLLKQQTNDFGELLDVSAFFERCHNFDDVLSVVSQSIAADSASINPQSAAAAGMHSPDSLFYYMSGYWHFWYLVMVRQMEKEHVPQSVAPIQLLKQLVLLCRAGFEKALSTYWTRKKTCELLGVIFQRLKRRSLGLNNLDPSTEAVPMINCLVMMSKHAACGEIHQEAQKRITEFLELFSHEGFYYVVQRSLHDIRVPEAVAFLIGRYKSRFAAEWMDEAGVGDAPAPAAAASSSSSQQKPACVPVTKVNKYFKLGWLKIFIRALIRLPLASGQPDYDIVHESPRVLSTMNFLIFLFVRDGRTPLGMLEIEPEITQKLINPLWSMLDFSRASYSNMSKALESGEPLAHLPPNEEKLISSLVKAEQVQFIDGCLNKLDMMACVLAQLRETIDDCKRKATSAEAVASAAADMKTGDDATPPDAVNDATKKS